MSTPSFTLVTMSSGMSMEAWHTSGLITRELGYLKSLSRHVGDICYLSYGSNRYFEETLLKKHFPDGRVLWTIPPFLSRTSYGLFLGSWLPPLSPSKFAGCRIIRSTQMSGAWTGALLARRLRVPFVLRCGYLFSKQVEREYSSHLVRRAFFHIEGIVARMADQVIVTYEGARNYFTEHHNIPAERIEVIGNPVDTDLFAPKDIVKTKDAIIVCRFTDQKNLFELIRASSISGVRLTLLGDGPLRHSLASYATQIGASVDFQDPIPNDLLPETLAQHRMFVFPTFYEGNPKALIEAMSCGMPCIASNISENTALIRDGIHGLLCATDAESIARCMDLIVTKPRLADRLGQMARQRILDEYSQEKIARREALLHARCIERNARN